MFYEAEAYCLEIGGSVTSIHSLEEETFLNDLANGNDYWIGAFPANSKYFWSDGTRFDYEHWYNQDSRYCVVQTSSRYGDGWSASNCYSSSYRYYSICKMF